MADALADHRLHDTRRRYFRRRISLSRTLRLPFHHGSLTFLAGVAWSRTREHRAATFDLKPGARVYGLRDDLFDRLRASHRPIAFQDLLRTTFD